MKTMKCALIATFAAAAMGFAGTASADATFDVKSIVVDPLDPLAFEMFDFNDHVLGTFETTGGAYPLMITSGNSSLAGYDHQLMIDYTQYDIGYFGQIGVAQIILNNLEDYGDVVANDSFGNAIGSLVFDNNKITWEAMVPQILAGGEVVTIHWTTSAVPTPGAVALLGLAGCVGVTRRRKH